MARKHGFLKRFPAVVGWREWVTLPKLGIDALRAKLDTGADTSALHAAGIKLVVREGRSFVRFKVHPRPEEPDYTARFEAPLLGERWVKNSGGQRHLRPVIRTPMCLGGLCWSIELTLTRRDRMNYAMLLGRQALAGNILVDSSRSYMAGYPLHLPADWRPMRRRRLAQAVPAPDLVSGGLAKP